MKCPNCPDATLTMAERQGVEIDYCPRCRGVWLDRGELVKLVERAASPPQTQAPAARVQPDFVDSDHHLYGHTPRRRKSWLGEIFD